MKDIDRLASTIVLSDDKTHAMLPNDVLVKIVEVAHLYEEALNQIVEWGPIGGTETAAAAGQAFQFIAQEALKGNQ